MLDVGYLSSLIIFTGIFALFSLGLNLQWGFTGLINFGHIAFMTVGAYATVIFSLNGVPLIVATLIGAAIAALLGLAIGFSTLRLRDDYLAIVTIGVSEMIRLIALNEAWLTRGPSGLYGYPLPLADFNPNGLGKVLAIAGLTVIVGLALFRLWKRPVSHRRVLLTNSLVTLFGVWLYAGAATALYNYTYKAGLMALLIFVLALTVFALERLVYSPWGRVIKAIREDEQVAKALGKNVFWYKLQALMLGGFIAGIAGAFYAWQLTFINPDGFIPLITFQAWIIVVLGGAGNNWGTLLGATVFWAYDTLTRFVLKDIIPLDDTRLGAFRIMIIGLILMVLMIWRPQGILGNKEELTLGK